MRPLGADIHTAEVSLQFSTAISAVPRYCTCQIDFCNHWYVGKRREREPAHRKSSTDQSDTRKENASRPYRHCAGASLQNPIDMIVKFKICFTPAGPLSLRWWMVRKFVLRRGRHSWEFSTKTRGVHRWNTEKVDSPAKLDRCRMPHASVLALARDQQRRHG